MKLSDLATNVARSTQAAVKKWITEHGRERGLAMFARNIGITERRARSLAEGTAGRIDAAEYIAAQQARAEILRRRIARAQLILTEIEGSHGMDLGVAGGRASEGGNGAYFGGDVVPQAGAKMGGA